MEDALGLALVALVVGTRPFVSPAMVSHYLLEHFDIPKDSIDVCRNEPEDFLVRFSRREDRDRVLTAVPSGGLLPLTWHPWRRTSSSTGGTLRCLALIGLRNVPHHARSVAVAQSILGHSFAAVVGIVPGPREDGREFFVKAWCRDLRFIPNEEIILIPEPRVYDRNMLGLCPEDIIHLDLSGQHYLVRLRIVEYQDWNMPPSSPCDDGYDDDDACWDDDDDDDSGDSNHNRFHPGIDNRRGGGGRWPAIVRLAGDGNQVPSL